MLKIQDNNQLTIVKFFETRTHAQSTFYVSSLRTTSMQNYRVSSLYYSNTKLLKNMLDTQFF